MIRQVELVFVELAPHSLNAGKVIRQMKGVPSVNPVKSLGNKYRLYISDIPTSSGSLVNHSRSIGRKIISLNIPAPSLEDAFIALTERGLK